MGGIGIEKILLIGVVCLLLFGAKRLPEIGASLGKGIREFKGSLSDVQSAVSTPVDVRPIGRPTTEYDQPSEPSTRANSEPKRLLE